MGVVCYICYKEWKCGYNLKRAHDLGSPLRPVSSLAGSRIKSQDPEPIDDKFIYLINLIN